MESPPGDASLVATRTSTGAGTYKVAVDAYYPHYGGWQQFDSITISVVRG
jgi:hypothetical protein